MRLMLLVKPPSAVAGIPTTDSICEDPPVAKGISLKSVNLNDAPSPNVTINESVCRDRSEKFR